jgi:hypothetical protein
LKSIVGGEGYGIQEALHKESLHGPTLNIPSFYKHP